MDEEIGESAVDLFKDLVMVMGRKDSVFDNLEDTLGRHIDEYEKLGEESVPLTRRVNDSYGNALTSVGTDDKVSSFAHYGFNNDTLNWPLWLALYNDSWVFRRAIDKPAQDEVNCGFVLSGPADHSAFYAAYKRYKFDFDRLLRWGALFGGSVAVMLFDSIPDEEMQYSINKEKIKGARMRLYVTDRWYGVSESTERVTTMTDMDFGQPKYYDITFADGRRLKVHHTYVLRYEHRTAPQLVKCGQLQGWGYAEGAHIVNELARDDQLKSSIASLVNKALIEVIKMPGMRGVFMGAEDANAKQLQKRLQMVNWARSYNSLTFLDKEDEYEQRELSNLSGLSQLLETNMWQVAAALEMTGVLFGELKGGLSQETDAKKRYAQTIKNRCDSYFRPVLSKFLTVVSIIEGVIDIPTFEFRLIDEDEEVTERLNNLEKFVNILDGLGRQGIITKYQGAEALRNFMTDGSLKIELDETYMDALEWEQESQILATYSARKKAGAAADILQNQFPEAVNPFVGQVTNDPEVLTNESEQADPLETQ